MTVYTFEKDGFLITTDKHLFDVDAIHSFLTNSEWAKGISRNNVKKSIKNSLAFGLFFENKQIGFARVVTDYVTFGYLCDVYILKEYRKKGLGKWLMICCHSHPSIKELRKMLLVTDTAPWLYERIGYFPVTKPNFVWQKN